MLIDMALEDMMLDDAEPDLYMEVDIDEWAFKLGLAEREEDRLVNVSSDWTESITSIELLNETDDDKPDDVRGDCNESVSAVKPLDEMDGTTT